MAINCKDPLSLEEIKKHIGRIPDFPKRGIVFRDIGRLLQQPFAFQSAIYHLAAWIKTRSNITALVGIETRGLIFAAPLATLLHLPLVMIRRNKKLPGPVKTVAYATEYALEQRQIQVYALNASDNVIIIDDLIALGGTVSGAIQLVESLNAQVDSVLCLVNLIFLKKIVFLQKYLLHSLIQYQQDE